MLIRTFVLKHIQIINESPYPLWNRWLDPQKDFFTDLKIVHINKILDLSNHPNFWYTYSFKISYIYIIDELAFVKGNKNHVQPLKHQQDVKKNYSKEMLKHYDIFCTAQTL